MNKDIQNRLKRTAVMIVVALVIGAGWGLYEAQNQPAQITQKEATEIEPMAGVSVGGPFELLGEDGEIVTQATYAGKYKLIFFGFTFCPAICPGELQKMHTVLEALGPEASKVQPLFISVDPERDTPDVVKEYMTLYDPRIDGLTGSRAQIDDVMKNYKVYASKVEMPSMSDYMIDHSAFMYFMSPDNQLITLYPLQDTAEDIASDLRKRLANS